MSLKLRIKNFGKLSDEEINIGRFTVFAGPNNTGKSTVSKLLYSLFDAMNVNHALVHFDDLANILRRRLNRLERWSHESEDLPLSLLNDDIDAMEDLVKSCSIDDSEHIEELWNQIVNCATEFRKKYEEFKPSIEKWSHEQSSYPSHYIAEILEETEKEVEKLCSTIEETDGHQFAITGLKRKIFHNLTYNFQVRNLSFLKKQLEESSEVFIDGVGSFEFMDSESIDFSIEQAGFQQLQDYSGVIYLESPIYWKLKSALENVRTSPRFLHRGRNRLIGVPSYFYDLAWALTEEYPGDIVFPKLYEKLTSKEVMGGKLIISKTGELSFQENGRNFPLPITAMGIVNLGILALLIERKIIDKGTFLFIDEPEAHLHPSWQVEIAKTLFELSNSGINVVIATHSIEILKFIEVEIEKNPENEKFIALNHFSYSGVKNYEDDFNSKLMKIQEELTNPFSELYLEGL